MYKQPLIIALALAAGIAIGAFGATRTIPDRGSLEGHSRDVLGDLIGSAERDEPLSTDPAALARTVESLARILDEEIAERRLLTERLEEMHTQLRDLEENLGSRLVEAFDERSVASGNMGMEQPFVDMGIEDRLLATGFTSEQVAGLRRREDERVMRQIDLDDRARREGWLNSPRYFEELNSLMGDSDPIRRELGDDGYDRYLFAMGRPNRVTVGRVIETSPAEQAGLQQGDMIISYAGERVFSTQQLTTLRSQGDRGAPVTVEILRNGKPMQITLPRGPMGVQTAMDVIDPSAPPAQADER